MIQFDSYFANGLKAPTNYICSLFQSSPILNSLRPKKNQKRQGGTGAQPGAHLDRDPQAEYQDAEAERKKAEAGKGSKIRWWFKVDPCCTVAINGVKLGYNPYEWPKINGLLG